MNKSILLALLLASSMGYAENITPDREQGRIKASNCGYCHGKTGIASNPMYPDLKGQNATYLVSSMQSYQKGKRQGAMAKMMQQQLRKLNDQDLADIAAYYQSMGAK